MQKTMTIHFKDGRPPLTSVPYTETNIRDYEKNLGDVIKEFVIDRSEQKIFPAAKEEIKKSMITLADLTPDVKFALFKELEDKHIKDITAMGKIIVELKEELDNLKKTAPKKKTAKAVSTPQQQQ